MRVVLDSNIHVSALTLPAGSARLIVLHVLDHFVVTGEPLISFPEGGLL